MNPGLHNNVPEDIYFGIDAVSQSILKLVAKCPALVKAPQREPTAAMAFGSLADCILFEPEEFDNRYEVAPDAHKNSNLYKGAKEAAEKVGKRLVSSDEKTIAEEMATATRDHPTAMKLLCHEDVTYQAVLIWVDEETGLKCKARVDIAIPEINVAADFKTTESAETGRFTQSITRYGYHIQDAFYSDGWKAVLGEMPDFAIIATEKAAPYLTQAFALDEDFRKAGRRQYREYLRTYAQCLERDEWPGYSDRITEIPCPYFLRLT